LSENTDTAKKLSKHATPLTVRTLVLLGILIAVAALQWRIFGDHEAPLVKLYSRDTVNQTRLADEHFTRRLKKEYIGEPEKSLLEDFEPLAKTYDAHDLKIRQRTLPDKSNQLSEKNQPDCIKEQKGAKIIDVSTLTFRLTPDKAWDAQPMIIIQWCTDLSKDIQWIQGSHYTGSLFQ